MTRPLGKVYEEVCLAKRSGETVVRVAVLLAACLSPILAFAQNDIWLGGTGFWSDASKWSAGVPTSSKNVFIDNGKSGASPVTINYSGAQCGNLTVDGDDSLIMVDGTIFTLYGPTISNSGNIFLNSAGFGVDFNFGGAVTLTGAGTLTMSNSSANANQTTPLTISVGSGAVTNTGTLEATNGATLALSGSGTVINTGGTLHADPASIVSLYGVTINGGTLTTSGTGTIQATCCLNYSTLNGVTLNGTFSLIGNNIGYLGGAITDNGSMLINSGATLDIVGAVPLKGSGSLTISNNSALMGYAQAAGASLTSQIPIQGAGSITPSSGSSFTNQATVNANQTNPLTINSGNGSVTNTGTLEATNGATLALDNGTVTNTGGTIHADPASIVSLYNITVSGGTLTTSGTGTIEAVCCLGYSTLDGVTLNGNGTFQWISNNIGYLHGTITNNSSMKFTAPSGTSVILDVNGAVTLKGIGTLTSTNSNNQIMGYAQSTGASLLNQSTIQGTVGISAQNGNTITNQGTIYANETNPLTIGMGNGGTFTNMGMGTLKVKKGSAMYVTGGGFNNFSGSTLTGGKYMVSGTLGFDGANIATNAAGITLTGSTSQIINDLNSANALANLATNTTTGSLSLMSG